MVVVVVTNIIAVAATIINIIDVILEFIVRKTAPVRQLGACKVHLTKAKIKCQYTYYIYMPMYI